MITHFSICEDTHIHGLPFVFDVFVYHFEILNVIRDLSQSVMSRICNLAWIELNGFH